MRRDTSTTDLKSNRTQSVAEDATRVTREDVATTNTGDGRLTERQIDGGPPQREMIRDIPKNNSEVVRYNPDGSVKSRERSTREFDAHGNMIKTVSSVAIGDSENFQPTFVTYRTIEYFEKR